MPRVHFLAPVRFARFSVSMWAGMILLVAASPGIAVAAPDSDPNQQRRKTLEAMGRQPSQQSAATLVDALDDPDPDIRRVAVQGLRRFASRIERRGVVDVPLDAQFPPQIEGLVSHLIVAAQDDDPDVRSLALWALADSKEAVAADEIRRHLEDADRRVRFQAACLLSEFGDNAGLPLLGDSLLQAARDEKARGGLFITDIECLLASLARLEPDGPGSPPMNPLLASSMVRGKELSAEYAALLSDWASWWEEHHGRE
jgi:HEAT repeat protein